MPELQTCELRLTADKVADVYKRSPFEHHVDMFERGAITNKIMERLATEDATRYQKMLDVAKKYFSCLRLRQIHQNSRP